MAGPFQQFVSDPNVSFVDAGSVSPVGEGLKAAGAALEAALGVDTAIKVHKAKGEIEQIEQQAQEGVVSFREALNTRAKALQEGDREALKAAGNKINTLLAGQQQGKLSPLAVQAGINRIVRQNKFNPRVSQHLAKVLAQSNLLQDGETAQELEQLGVIEQQIREVALKNNTDFATAYNFINQQAAAQNAKDVADLAASRGQLDFTQYSSGVRANTSLLLDGGVVEQDDGTVVEYEPIVSNFLNQIREAGSDPAKLPAITSNFKAALELRRQAALSYAAQRKDSFEQGGRLMDNTDYSNTLAEINARFDGIQKVLDSQDPVENMKKLNEMVTLQSQQFRNDVLKKMGQNVLVGADAEFQIKFMLETLPSLSGKVKSMNDATLERMAAAGDKEAAMALAFGRENIGAMVAIYNQITDADSLSETLAPSLAEAVAKEVRSTLSRTTSLNDGDVGRVKQMNRLLIENGLDLFDRSTRNMMVRTPELQEHYDTLVQSSLPQYINTYVERFSDKLQDGGTVVVRNPDKGGGGVMSTLFDAKGPKNIFFMEGVEARGGKTAGFKRSTPLTELNNAVINLSSYKDTKEVGEWVGLIISQLRAAGLNVKVDGFEVENLEEEEQ